MGYAYRYGEFVPYVAMQLETLVEGCDRLSSIQTVAAVALYGVDAMILAVQALAELVFGAIFADYLSGRMQGGFISMFSMASTKRAVSTRKTARLVVAGCIE